MGIGQTGRITERADFRTVVNAAVAAYDRKKAVKSKNSFVNILRPTSVCSQCARKMRKDIADIQIENKRKNAPICIACILGNPRKEKTTSPVNNFSHKTKIAFNRYKKTHHPKNFIKL